MASLRPRPAREREKGAALVEFALSLPLLLVVIAGIVDFAFLFQRYEVVTNAAREGARIGTTPVYAGQFDLVRAHAQSYVRAGLGMTQAAVDAVVPVPQNIDVSTHTRTYTIDGNTYNIEVIRVEVTYEHDFLLLGPVLALIGGSWGDSFDIIGVSEMRLEAPGSET